MTATPLKPDFSLPAVPKPMTLIELLEREYEPLRHVVDKLQYEGDRVLLVGAAKSGKTTLMGHLIKCLVDGGMFLDRYHVRPIVGRLALIDTEMSERRLQTWLGRIGIENTDKVLLWSLRKNKRLFDILDQKIRSAWAAMFREQEVSYVVLDCLRPLMDSLALNEHSEAGQLLVAFDEFLGEAEIGEAVVVHHSGHRSERARGDSRIKDWCDAEWRLVLKDPNDDASPRYFKAYGRDVDEPEHEVGLDEDGVPHVVGGSRRLANQVARTQAFQDQVGEAVGAVLLVLAEARKPLNTRDLEAAVKGRKHALKAARKAIAECIESGEVLQDTHGKTRLHSITKAGLSELGK